MIDNQFLFFFLILAQYIVLMEFQGTLKEHKYGKYLYYAFIPQDWLMNLIMTIWFLDLPKTWNELVTGRMKRYKLIEINSGDVGLITLLKIWRYYFAYYLCKILNIFEKDHC